MFFAVRSAERAAIWRSAASLVADAAAHYPEGVSANLLRAKRAAQFGDVAEVAAALRAAARRGYTLFEPLENDPAFAGLREHPEFRAVISEIAEGWIVRGRAREDPTQQELQMIGHAHFARGEKAEAIAALRRALAKGGPRDRQIRADLAALGAPEPEPSGSRRGTARATRTPLGCASLRGRLEGDLAVIVVHSALGELPPRAPARPWLRLRYDEAFAPDGGRRTHRFEAPPRILGLRKIRAAGERALERDRGLVLAAQRLQHQAEMVGIDGRQLAGPRLGERDRALQLRERRLELAGPVVDVAERIDRSRVVAERLLQPRAPARARGRAARRARASTKARSLRALASSGCSATTFSRACCAFASSPWLR